MPIVLKGTNKPAVVKEPIKDAKISPYDQHFTEQIKTSAVIGTKTVHHTVSGQADATKPDTQTHEKVMDSGFIPPHELCTMYVRGGRKFNMGNYESMEVSVGISIPCRKDDFNDMYEFASDYVSEKISEAAIEIKGEE